MNDRSLSNIFYDLFSINRFLFQHMNGISMLQSEVVFSVVGTVVQGNTLKWRTCIVVLGSSYMRDHFFLKDTYMHY